MSDKYFKLKEVITILEQKPGMIFTHKDYTYRELEAFLNGFLICLGEFHTTPSFSEWINNKYKKSSLFWGAYVYVILAKEDETVAKKVLLREINDFLADET